VTDLAAAYRGVRIRVRTALGRPGRRSSEQVATYEWVGDARPDLLVLATFTPRVAALVE
jgi:hypothetical protein